MIFIRFVDFKCITASNTASDDVTNYRLSIFLCSFRCGN